MRIVIFGGTTEGRQLSEQLADAGHTVIVCVASAYGKEAQGFHTGVQVHAGTLSAEEKAFLLEGADLCLDATHPYAIHVTESVKEACAEAGVHYLRLRRKKSKTEAAVEVESAAEAAAYLQKTKGNILLTTGAKELPAFLCLDKERLYPRVLPSGASLEICEKAGIPRKNIIAMQGPFTREMNVATIRQFHIAYLVSKDGGIPGGFPEKQQAVRETGIRMILLRRPEEEGLTYENVLERCLGSVEYRRLREKAEGSL